MMFIIIPVGMAVLSYFAPTREDEIEIKEPTIDLFDV